MASADDFVVPTTSRSKEIHDQLGHPVIDSDGHILEFEPAVFDILRDLAGPDLVEAFRTSWQHNNYGNHVRNNLGQFLAVDEAMDVRAPRSPWWGLPTRRTVDRAVTSLPALLDEYLDLIGLDYTVLFPTFGLYTLSLDNAEFRQAGCRAVNTYNAQVAKGFEDRMTTVAVIPMHTPDEAVAELRYAVNELGFKAAVLQSYVIRPVPKLAREHPDLAHYSQWVDVYCLDSIYDYEPVWAECEALGVSPTFHTPGYFGSRQMVSSWMHNHIGAFAAGAEAIARALLFGGVPARHPGINFGFLEGGVGYGVALYADAISRWTKRNRNAVHDYNPANIDRELLTGLFARYGGPMVQERLDRVGQQEMKFKAFTVDDAEDDGRGIDEFAAMGIEQAEQFKEVFESFYFGCEADDPMNCTAFNAKANPFGARLNAVLSSDIGHFDVPDISEVLEEAYEAVEHGVMTLDDFRDFTFTNPARFWTGANPDFFRGTRVEAAVAALITA